MVDDCLNWLAMIAIGGLVLFLVNYLTNKLTAGKTPEEPVEEEEDIIVETTTTTLTREPVNSVLEILDAENVEEITRQFETLDEVTRLMKKAGLNCVNLIFGIDYTASNYRQGTKTFNGLSLHDVTSGETNPYQQVIKTLGSTLQPLSSTGCIPAFGFGDSSSRDISIFPLKAEGDCLGFEEVLEVYNAITPTVRLSGPTNFAPLIKRAISIVQKTKMYHILVIVADGQVTKEMATRDAIVEASKYALSIILIGVGDGPWEEMTEYDEQLPEREFDNFHFVDFHKAMDKNENKETAFAIQALYEIPDQYKCVLNLKYI